MSWSVDEYLFMLQVQVYYKEYGDIRTERTNQILLHPLLHRSEVPSPKGFNCSCDVHHKCHHIPTRSFSDEPLRLWKSFTSAITLVATQARNSGVNSPLGPSYKDHQSVHTFFQKRWCLASPGQEEAHLPRDWRLSCDSTRVDQVDTCRGHVYKH